MEAESTVMTVSQGINRPKGANTALNFLAGGMPAELSTNRLMGESAGNWFAGTTGKGSGDAMVTDEPAGDDLAAVVISGLAAGG